MLARVLFGQSASSPLSQGHNVEAVENAAQLMYYGGDLTEVLPAAALFSSWFTRGVGRRRPVRSRQSSVVDSAGPIVGDPGVARL